jgi:hypothetical protein
MAGKPIDYANLLAVVNQIMRICVQTTATTEALASLLIDKGLVTRGELDAKIREHQETNQKLADALGAFGSETES